MKVVETIGIQKRVLEDENEELKSRISEMLAERDAAADHSRIDMSAAAAGAQHLSQSTGIPPLNLSSAKR
jgi:hypothetical protein